MYENNEVPPTQLEGGKGVRGAAAAAAGGGSAVEELAESASGVPSGGGRKKKKKHKSGGEESSSSAKSSIVVTDEELGDAVLPMLSDGQGSGKCGVGGEGAGVWFTCFWSVI